MPAPYFTTNPGEFTRLEGLYILEQNPPAFISGVFLGVVAVAGQTLKGPVDTPVSITSEARFTEVFGHASRPGDSTSVNKVREFLLNKPFGEVIVVRAAAAGALPAEADFDETATAIINIAASSPGAWGNDITVDITAASDGDADHFNLVVKYRGETTTYENLDTSTGNNNLVDVIGTDLANLVVVTKQADGRPDNVSDAALADTAGTDGSIADSDYTDTGRAIKTMANFQRASIFAVADRSNMAIKGEMEACALAADKGLFLIWNGSHSADITTVTGDAASYRSDRIVYCYNSTKTIDPDTAAEIVVPPHSWVASILSQTDVDIHPGEEGSKAYTGAITGLVDESISRADYVTLKEAGVAAWEKDEDGGHLIVSGVTTDLTAGKTEITRRRMADFLQLSAASRLKFFVKKKNTAQNRIQMAAELIAFSNSLKDDERVIEEFAVEQKSVNSEATRAQGIEKLLWRVKIIGHMLHLVLVTEIGTTVTFQEEA